LFYICSLNKKKKWIAGILTACSRSLGSALRKLRPAEREKEKEREIKRKRKRDRSKERKRESVSLEPVEGHGLQEAQFRSRSGKRSLLFRLAL
jgi:Sec-independent protein translocase protein TatA